MTDRIQFRRGTAAQWDTANPILAAGEPGHATDAGTTKIGDGVTPWADLTALPDTDALSAFYANKATQTTVETGRLSDAGVADTFADHGIREADPTRPIDSNAFVKLQSSHDDPTGMVIWAQKVAGDSDDINVDGSIIVKHGKSYVATPGYADTVQVYTLAGSAGTIVGNNDYDGYASTLPYAPGPDEDGAGFVRFELGPLWPRSEVGRFNNSGDLLLGGWNYGTTSGLTYTQSGTTVTQVSGADGFSPDDVGRYLLWDGAGGSGNADRITAYIDPTNVTVERSRSIPVARGASVRIPTTTIRLDSTVETYDGLKVKARNGQTGNIQEWQTADGTVVGSVLAAGTTWLNGQQLVINGTVDGSDQAADVMITTRANNEKALVLRPKAPQQTHNLFEAQYFDTTAAFALDKEGRPVWSSYNMQTTVGASGPASALPAAPKKYLKAIDTDGSIILIPAYRS